MMSTPSRQYATDVTDVQWRRIEPLLPASTWQPNGPGRPPRDRRQIVNGLLYLSTKIFRVYWDSQNICFNINIISLSRNQ